MCHDPGVTAHRPGKDRTLSLPPENQDDVRDRLRSARLAGRLMAAVGEVSTALSAGAVSPAVVAEAVRVFIVAGTPDTAERLRRLLAEDPQPGPDHELEPAALARLALQLGRGERVLDLPAVEGPAWLAHLRKFGEDPLLPFDARALKVSVVNGPALFTVHGACPHCGHERTFDLRGNLMVRVSGLCPACFGSYEVTYAGLRTLIRDRYGDLAGPAVRAGDQDLVEHVRARLLESADVPEIVRALGQEYQFLLNEIVARRLMGDGGAQP